MEQTCQTEKQDNIVHNMLIGGLKTLRTKFTVNSVRSRKRFKSGETNTEAQKCRIHRTMNRCLTERDGRLQIITHI